VLVKTGKTYEEYGKVEKHGWSEGGKSWSEGGPGKGEIETYYRHGE
jgi:hypothetical protein